MQPKLLYPLPVIQILQIQLSLLMLLSRPPEDRIVWSVTLSKSPSLSTLISFLSATSSSAHLFFPQIWDRSPPRRKRSAQHNPRCQDSCESLKMTTGLRCLCELPGTSSSLRPASRSFPGLDELLMRRMARRIPYWPSEE